MVGDSVASDIRGGRGVGMRTVLYAPSGAEGASERAEGASERAESASARAESASERAVSAAEADVVVASFAELAEKVMGPSR